MAGTRSPGYRWGVRLRCPRRSLGTNSPIRLFAYSLVRDVRLAPPPGAFLLSDLPPALRIGFERAFGVGLGARYGSAEWVEALRGFESDLAPCLNDAVHLAGRHQPSCPWCRIERVTGRATFGAVRKVRDPYPRPRPTTCGNGRPACWTLEGMNLGKVEPPRVRIVVAKAAEATSFFFRDGGEARRGLLRSVAKLDGGVSDDVFTRRHVRAELQLGRALADWRCGIGVEDVRARATALGRDVARLTRVTVARAAALAAVRRSDPGRVADRMRAFRVAEARVPGLADGRRALLSTAGVLSAADVSRAGLRAIIGIGTWCAASLLVWRDEVEAAALQDDPFSDRAAAGRAGVVARSDGLERELVRRVGDGTESLTKAVARLEALTAFPDGDVDRARREVGQAAEDVRFVGLSLPGEIPLAAWREVRGKAGKGGKLKAAGGKKCPECGGGWSGAGVRVVRAVRLSWAALPTRAARVGDRHQGGGDNARVLPRSLLKPDKCDRARLRWACLRRLVGASMLLASKL